MILLVTNEQDLTTDYIVTELRRRGIKYFRLNTERLPTSRVRIDSKRGFHDIDLDFPEMQFRTNEISAAYFRRPAPPAISLPVSDAVERKYCEQEWSSLLRALYVAIENKWLNSPTSIALAENKTFQLYLASREGLQIPRTLITNDHEAAVTFLRENVAVGKPLYSGFLDDPDGTGRVIFTSRLPPLKNVAPQAMKLAPVTLQQEILKKADIRVTVVGDRVFAAQIESQSKSETEVDWRRGGFVDLPHSIIHLPHVIEQKCINLVRELRLKFAAIDLILDRQGDYWFLEANPNGQWAWIENRTGLPISAALVDLLVQIGSEPSRP